MAAARGQFGVRHAQVDGAVGDVDVDEVALFHQADGAAFGRFRRAWPITRPEEPPEKRPSVNSAQPCPGPSI
jgi:hypothetical protein